MTTVLNPRAKSLSKPPAKMGAIMGLPKITKEEMLVHFHDYPLALELRKRLPLTKRIEVHLNIIRLIQSGYPVNLMTKNLNLAFPWGGTPQGPDYWLEIFNDYFGGFND